MVVCDICESSMNVSEVEVLAEVFEICDDCVNDLVNSITADLLPQGKVDLMFSVLSDKEFSLDCWLAGGCQ